MNLPQSLLRIIFLKAVKGVSNISVCILNLNPCYDHWIILKKRPAIENVIRGDEVIRLVDGKGLNIARVMTNVLDFKDYFCINVLGGEVGKIIEYECKVEGINTKNFWIKDTSRINTAIVYEYENRMTMINEPGPKMSNQEIGEFKSFFKENLNGVSRLIISGSAAKGFDGENLVEIIEFARNKGCRIEIDIAGKWLKELIKVSPELIKINADELKVAFGIAKNDLKGMESFRVSNGIETLIITNGKDGSFTFSNEGIFNVRSKKIYSDFSVGSGDSFFAGLIYGLEKKLGLKESLKIATACGTANTLRYGAAIFDKNDLKSVLPEVVIVEVQL